jgi:hypothetical protein
MMLAREPFKKENATTPISIIREQNILSRLLPEMSP